MATIQPRPPVTKLSVRVIRALDNLGTVIGRSISGGRKRCEHGLGKNDLSMIANAVRTNGDGGKVNVKRKKIGGFLLFVSIFGNSYFRKRCEDTIVKKNCKQ